MIGFLYLLRRGVSMVDKYGRMELKDEFYCRPRRRRLAIEVCLDDFCAANAFDRKGSACHRCPQGKSNRRNFGNGGVFVEVTENDGV